MIIESLIHDVFNKSILGSGPGFEQKLYKGFEAISKTDAKIVQIIHSSTSLGMEAQAGTIDFYPNGGSHQPGGF